MQLARTTLASLCQQFGPQLTLPAGLDGKQLLWALAGNESTFGADMSPRHEHGYCYGGRYFDPHATRAWGCLAHCSYGPWQVMFPNFALGSNPLVILASPAVVAAAAVALIQKHIVGAEKATTLAQIADAYNAGDWHHKTPKDVPEQYIAKLVGNYASTFGALA